MGNTSIFVNYNNFVTMLFPTTNKNPYNFVSMEKWVSNRQEAYVGFTKEGDIYLTWDIREHIPIFSNSCKIGITTKIEDYMMIRELFETLNDKYIRKLLYCKYAILHYDKLCEFKLEKSLKNVLYNSRKPV